MPISQTPKKTTTKSSVANETPQNAVNSVPHDDTQIHRLPVFISSLGCMTHVEDTKISIFEKLHNKMSKNAKFTETQIKRAEEALKTSNEWKKWRSDMVSKSSGIISQNIFFRMLQKAQEVLQAQSTAKTRQAQNVFINIGTRVPKSGISNEEYAEGLKLFKPDLASIAIDVNKENVRFCDMKTTWELKKSADQTYAQSEIQLSLLRCNQVFRDDPFRHFIYSIYVAGRTLRLYQLNRGQVLCYESGLNIEQNTLGFLRFVNWLMLASDDAQGLAKEPSAIGRRAISFTPAGCKIPSPLVRVGVDMVTTRGTTVWAVKMQKPKPKKKKSRQSQAKKETENSPPEDDGLAALKMAWVYEARTSEADILSELSDIEELPKLFEWKDGPLTTAFDVLPEARHSRQYLKMGPNYRYMEVTHSTSSVMANQTRNKEAEKGLFMPEVNETAIESADEPLYARRQRWYLEEYCGVSVDTTPRGLSQHQYPNPRGVTELERIKALRSAVRAIRKMFCRDRPVIHRDISPANIMVTSPDMLNGEGAPPPGRLIDLDMACKPKPKKKKSRKPQAKKNTESSPTEGDDLAALKMAWVYEARTSEADILSELSDIEELPKLFEWKDGPLTAEFDVLPEAKHSRQYLKMGPNYRYMEVTHSTSSVMANQTQNKDAEKGLFMPEVKGTATKLADKSSYTRRQRWYLEEYCGVSVDTTPHGLSQHQYPSPRDVTELERIKALRSAVRAIRKMFCRDRPVIHRDISPANIMVTSPDMLNGEGATPPGRLIDLDMACIYGDPRSGAPWRTGTYLYMAINILMGEHSRHNPWHDIESVFWVLLFGELNRTPEGAKELKRIASAGASQPTEAEKGAGLGSRKFIIVSVTWNKWMGDNRLRLFGKTSFPVVRLIHRLRVELFGFDERKEPDHLATSEDVAAAAGKTMGPSINYGAHRFAVPDEKIWEEVEDEIGKVETGIEGLSSEEKADKTSQDKSNNPTDKESVGKSEKDLAIERLKQAVATITERIDGWFAECIEDLEKVEQQE
ncbi:uncharacterized protein Z518_01786 [Rhinocladiella mackenziei CBS 650.93]|uniref:non-specific serine/threonine protein kinase n=1 Tax=Rhinocladiella mackenziei CBS 650.93 TaxID=1442369 RepID=A0A0D2G6V7_9EURO|nr:uncharacterized protein Z518_01786 [Rhinocladiella mackenziei CBS 650.93]KIX10702.1 hypothetical protein Z518_01786 [Rhinocladiella mackenziei CBS 650.93]